MDEHILISSRDTLLVAVPFVFMLLITVLRLDQIIATPRGSMNRRRPPCGMDASGQPVLRDPDGRLSGPARPKKAPFAPKPRGLGSKSLHTQIVQN